MEGLLGYLASLSLTPEDPKVLCLCHVLHAPQLGMLGRSDFLQHWTSVFRNHQPPRTVHSATELVEFQTEAINDLERRLRSDSSYFQQVYRFIFDFGRDQGQKSLGTHWFT